MEAKKNFKSDMEAKESRKQNLENILSGSEDEKDQDELSELELEDVVGAAVGGFNGDISIPTG